MSTPSFAPSRPASVGRTALIVTAVILALVAAATVLALTAGTKTSGSPRVAPRVATAPSPAAPAAAGHVTSAVGTGTPFGGAR